LVPENLAGKRVLVLGLGRFGGGIGVSRFLVGEGARVTVTDLGEEAGLAESLSQLQGLPITFHLGGHQEQDFLESDLVVVNPAVKRNSPWLELARKNRIPLTAEMNLFFERCPAAIVAITGSNGKSTTTAMTRAVLEAGAGGKAGRKYNRVWLGGNIGKDNLLSEVKEIQAEDVVVLELSSFQLYDLGQIRRSPHVAILTNITPNHLDWHGTMDEYVRAKQNILRYQGKEDFAVFNRLDPCFREWQKCTPGQVRWYPAEPMEELKLKVPGRHNQVNAAAALAAGEIFGVDPQAARQALARYESLPHRLELVREFEGVRYYNDSIATTPESVIVAIESFPEKKVIILGGYDKKIPFDELVDKVVGQVEAVILIGQVREKLFELISRRKQSRQESRPVCEFADTLEQAVHLARKLAQPGSSVLLSPACASYDMFKNFQQRGNLFREYVEKLA